ncbi:MAG TPA: flagellar motor switch protein FliM, partial [Planctomycetes bacterium]|nr:flagellar motor switch protein FliM [Planctomycetota bacterium]
MPDLLSQDEINALLSAVEEVAEPGTAVQKDFGDDAVTPYDFSHPQRLSREHLRMLRNMHEVAVRNMAASLGAYLRGPVECRLISIDQMTYGEFIAGLPNPTCFNVVKVTPPDASLAIEMNPSIAFPVLDRLLGAKQLAGPLERPLTSIEFRLVAKVIEIIKTQLELVWRRNSDVRMERISQETNPHLVALAPPTEMVVAVVIEMHVGEHSGLVNVCVPFTPFQTVLSRFFTIGGYSYGKGGDKDAARKKLLAALKRVPLNVTVAVARTALPAQALGAAGVGSVIV